MKQILRIMLLGSAALAYQFAKSRPSGAKRALGLGSALAVLLAVAVGCADQDSPTALDGSAGLRLASTATDQEVSVVERTTALTRDYTVKAMIGPAGGELKIKEAGLYVAIPANALAQTTEIVLTAKAGKAYVFDFGPSPLSFAVPVKVEITTKESTLSKGDLQNKVKGAYYPGDATAELAEDGKVRVTEIYPIDFDLKSNKAKFHVEHFSGYLLSIP